MTFRIVRTGIWLYDGTVEKAVDIVALDYDWWYELAKADGILEPGELPEALGSDGFLYYARFQRAGKDNEPTWVDSYGHKSCKDAMSAAQQKVASPIKWKPNP